MTSISDSLDIFLITYNRAKSLDKTLSQIFSVESQYHFTDLLKLKRYRTLKFLFVKKFLNNIFSLENTCDGKFKVLTILGVRVELNRGGVKQNA